MGKKKDDVREKKVCAGNAPLSVPLGFLFWMKLHEGREEVPLNEIKIKHICIPPTQDLFKRSMSSFI